MDGVKLEIGDYLNQNFSDPVAEGLTNLKNFDTDTHQIINLVKPEVDDYWDFNSNAFQTESKSELAQKFSTFHHSSGKEENIGSLERDLLSDLKNDQSRIYIKEEFDCSDGNILEQDSSEVIVDGKGVSDERKICSIQNSDLSNSCVQKLVKQEYLRGTISDNDTKVRVTSKCNKERNPRKKHAKRLTIKHCKFCDFSTTHATSLKNHINGIHLQQKDFKCTFCEFSTLRKIVLTEHVNAIHLHLKLHKCSMCDFSTARQNYMKHHVNGVHLQRKKHKCDKCEFSTTQSHNLKIHIDDVHFQLKKLKCQSCKFSTSKKADLKRHVDAVHLGVKNLKCLYCDYATLRQYNLNCHLKNKHFLLCDQGLKPKCHKCESCDYRTSKKCDLKRHTLAVHLKIKDLKCHLCDYATQRKFNLECHMKRIHFKMGEEVDELSKQKLVKSGCSEVP